MLNTEELEIGTQVTDRDGFTGTIIWVTKWRGSLWYDVRFPSGVAVRYPEDIANA